jgi:hypothetical protein
LTKLHALPPAGAQHSDCRGSVRGAALRNVEPALDRFEFISCGYRSAIFPSGSGKAADVIDAGSRQAAFNASGSAQAAFLEFLPAAMGGIIPSDARRLCRLPCSLVARFRRRPQSRAFQVQSNSSSIAPRSHLRKAQNFRTPAAADDHGPLRVFLEILPAEPRAADESAHKASSTRPGSANRVRQSRPASRATQHSPADRLGPRADLAASSRGRCPTA